MRTTRRRIVVDDTPLARSIGARIRERRLRAGLSQQRLAEGRYTKAYVSALETGSAKPSMAALNFLAGRLGTTAAEILADPDPARTVNLFRPGPAASAEVLATLLAIHLGFAAVILLAVLIYVLACTALRGAVQVWPPLRLVMR